MFKIDVASASPTLPAPAAPGTPGYFSEGDPVAGTPATVVSGDFLNMLMMELLNVVLAGGLAPSKTSYTQVRDSIPGLVASANFSGIGHLQIKTATGSFILNWGYVSLTDNSGFKDVTFDLPFPTACLVSFASPASGPANPSAWAGTGGATSYPTATGMRVGLSICPAGGGSGVPATAGATAYWFAIGH